MYSMMSKDFSKRVELEELGKEARKNLALSEELSSAKEFVFQ